jgi:hypothetical protein
MTLTVGQEVQVTRPWPIRPGGAVTLQPGDHGRVVSSTETHAAIDVSGTVVLVPVNLLRALKDAQNSGADEKVDESWFDGWASEMDKHRRRRHRNPSD